MARASDSPEVKAKADATNAVWRAANPERVRAYSRNYVRHRRATDPVYVEQQRDASRLFMRARMLATHGLTLVDFGKLLEKQGFGCAVCGSKFDRVDAPGRSREGKPHIDHDHETGKVRGLLCLHCNSLLGYARDNVDVLLNAVEYLRRTQQEGV